jgi:hypothetical protein
MTPNGFHHTLLKLLFFWSVILLRVINTRWVSGVANEKNRQILDNIERSMNV